MAVHAEDALRCSSISQVFNLLLTVPTLETIRAERLVTRENSQVFDLGATARAAVRAVVADERSVTQKKKVRVRIEERAAGVASKAIYVPAIPSYRRSVSGSRKREVFRNLPSSNAFPSSRILRVVSLTHVARISGLTSPQPLQGKAASSASYGDSGFGKPESTVAAAMVVEGSS